MEVVLSNFVRNDGAPGICAAALLTGGAVNIVGDIYFVFDFGLGMGMSGAGLATALGQVVALGGTLHLISCGKGAASAWAEGERRPMSSGKSAPRALRRPLWT